MRDVETVMQHVQNFRLLIDQMSAADIAVDVDDQVINLMQSMPSTFKNLMNSLRGQTNLTVQILISYLL